MASQPWPSSLALALALVAVVALIGTCISRAAWKRAAKKQKHIADHWLHRCEAAQAREQAAQVATANPSSAAVKPTMMPLDASRSAPLEPFEHRYLDALCEEGVDLSAFLDGWCRAMDADLARLSVLRHQDDPDDLRSVLHRLSGAVGLVGARGLMEGLRRASTSPRERDAGAIDALIDRAKSLVKQLEALPAVHRSTEP
ncbi:Hpt domain-containing protein [Paraburkholderia ribeironis]|nr:Hpt domain-containing protein [Paraburkholderia ribeironis]